MAREEILTTVIREYNDGTFMIHSWGRKHNWSITDNNVMHKGINRDELQERINAAHGKAHKREHVRTNAIVDLGD